VGLAERIRRKDQQRKADPVRLVQPAVGLAPVPVEPVGVEIRKLASGVLIADVDVRVPGERLGRQQVVGLVTAVLGGAESAQPERGRVGGEQQRKEGGGPAHVLTGWPRTRATAPAPASPPDRRPARGPPVDLGQTTAATSAW
jgi:hypothetical protein